MAIKFDLTGIVPNNVTVKSATLELSAADNYYWDWTGDWMKERGRKQGWLYTYLSQISWTESGPASAVTSIGSKNSTFNLPGSYSSSKVPLDVKTEVQTFVNNPSSNKGIIIVSGPSSGNPIYCLWSSRADNLNLRPKLIIEYY